MSWSKRQITEVIDGDTIKFANGDYGRLARVRAPEKNQRGYETAKKVLESIIYREDCVNSKTVGNSYDRLVVELSNSEGSINDRMIKKGYGGKGN